MELIQIHWEDDKKLFLDFKKNIDEKKQLMPETVRRFNLKYEISRINSNSNYHNALPELVSIKNFDFYEDSVSFSINLDDLIDLEEVRINFINLTVLTNSGKRNIIPIRKTLDLSDINCDGDFYYPLVNDEFEVKIEENDIETSITKEKVYHKVEKDYKNNTTKGVFIYERDKAILNKSPNELISVICENNQRLERVEQELKNLTEALKYMSSNNMSVAPSLGALPPPPANSAIPRRPIRSIKRLPSARTTSLGSSKKLFLGELKALFNGNKENNKNFHFKDILKPMSEEELSIVILNEEEIIKREEIVIIRQLEKYTQTKALEMDLEKLKKPAF